MVKDINPGTTASNPDEFLNFKGTLFFAAAGSGTNKYLWRSDGTDAGTVQIADRRTPQTLTTVGDIFFFRGATSALWKSDGTDTGTVIVKNVTIGTPNLVAFNGLLYFATSSALNKSDGTDSGTVVVKAVSLVDKLLNVNGTLFFCANDGVNGTELWKSDGTTDGTVLVKDIRPGSASGDPNGTNIGDKLLHLNGTVYFSATDGTNGVELWKSDGTEAGTVMIEIRTGANSSSPRSFAVLGTTLYFSATNNDEGMGLFKLEASTGISSFPRGKAGLNLNSSGSEVFNMQGQKVQPANAGTGIYLMQDKAGQTLRKVMIVR